jgi:hypothetical protein
MWEEIQWESPPVFLCRRLVVGFTRGGAKAFYVVSVELSFFSCCSRREDAETAFIHTTHIKL